MSNADFHSPPALTMSILEPPSPKAKKKKKSFIIHYLQSNFVPRLPSILETYAVEKNTK